MKVHSRGVAYIDDLRDIKTIDGKKIKPLLLYRSSNLSKIKDGGEKLYTKYHVRNVFDLRTEHELENKPEKLTEKINYVHVPTVENAENRTVTKESRLGILKDIANREGGSLEYMRQFYLLLVSSPKSIAGYKAIFKTLLEAKEGEATLFHCTQGKDRTGMVLLLILSALNVAKDVIIRKYMQYNLINWAYKLSIKVAMTLFKSPRLAIALDHLLSARKVYINSAIQEIDEKYGGIDNYLRNIIGLSDNDINLLRLKYSY